MGLFLLTIEEKVSSDSRFNKTLLFIYDLLLSESLSDLAAHAKARSVNELVTKYIVVKLFLHQRAVRIHIPPLFLNVQ